MSFEPRVWQREALDAFLKHIVSPEDGAYAFLLHAVPAAGKTKFTLWAASQLRELGMIQRLLVIAPTCDIRDQFAEEAKHFGWQMTTNELSIFSGFDSAAVTFHSLRTGGYGYVLDGQILSHDTLIVVDEGHHSATGEANGEGNTWGSSVYRLGAAAGRRTIRLILSGTPWRPTGQGVLPHVKYLPTDDGRVRAEIGFSYSYGAALVDRIVRKIRFDLFNAEAKLTNPRSGDRVAQLEDEDISDKEERRILRRLLSPHSQWLVDRLREADAGLVELRKEYPDAAGIVVAADQQLAKWLAKQICIVTGETPALVISDDEAMAAHTGSKVKPHQVIKEFRAGGPRWLVAVDMVSEGVDIPRARVLLYATTDSTRTRFEQICGRVMRRMGADDQSTARVILPHTKTLLSHAASLQGEIEHAFTEEQEAMQRELRDVQLGADLLPFQPQVEILGGEHSLSLYDDTDILPWLSTARDFLKDHGYSLDAQNDLALLLSQQARGQAPASPRAEVAVAERSFVERVRSDREELVELRSWRSGRSFGGDTKALNKLQFERFGKQDRWAPDTYRQAIEWLRDDWNFQW